MVTARPPPGSSPLGVVRRAPVGGVRAPAVGVVGPAPAGVARAAPVGQASPVSIRVVLADEHALMRRGLRRLLDVEADVEVVTEAGDLATAIRQVRRHLPRVLVIDLSMSNGSSIEAVRTLRRGVPGTEIVVLTMEESRVFSQTALDAGAIGFVLKQAAEAELAQAVRTAARGERFLSPRLAARLAG
jgi:two-component system, NarL family, response regulator NreC